MRHKLVGIWLVTIGILAPVFGQNEVASRRAECSGPKVAVRYPASAGSQYDEVARLLREIANHFDPGEAAVFADAYDPGIDRVTDTVRDLVDGTPSYLVVGDVTNLMGNDLVVSAFVAGCGVDLPGAALVVNTRGGFWIAEVQVVRGPGGTRRAKVIILLHELCHLLSPQGFNQNDAGDLTASTENDDFVVRHFPKTLAAMDKTSEANGKGPRQATLSTPGHRIAQIAARLTRGRVITNAANVARD